MNTLHGRIVVGILIMQDMAAIFALSILATVDHFSVETLFSTLTLSAGLILIVVFVLGRFVFPYLLHYLASERELLFVIVIGILFAIGFYAESQKLSIGIGAFLAGLSLSRLSYRYEIIGDLKALKMFFTILFFAALGLQLTPLQHNGATVAGTWTDFMGICAEHFTLIVLFLIFAVIVKPLLIMGIVSAFGYRRTTYFNTATSLGQLSEFSMVLIAQGIASHYVPASLLPVVIIVTVLSMTISSYVLKYTLQLYKATGQYFAWFEHLAMLKPSEPSTKDAPQNGFEVLLIGRDQLGRIIQQALHALGISYLVVDSNPDVIRKLQDQGIPCIFGDINNHEVLEQIDFSQVKTVFSTIPERGDNELILSHLKTQHPTINFIGIVDSRGRADELYDMGAHFVLVPYQLAGLQLIANRGEKGANLSSLLQGGENVRELGRKHRKDLYNEELETATNSN